MSMLTTRRSREWIFATLLIAVLTCVVSAPGMAGRASVGYAKHWLYKTGVQVITINMNDPDVRLTPIVANRGIGTSEGFGSILSRTRPTAAITGTFFDTRSLHPTGDIVIEGDQVCRGMVGTAVAVDWNNSVSFIYGKKGDGRDWSAYRFVVAAGPTLLSGGKPAVFPRAQGFRDGSHFKPRIRTAVGVTKWNKLMFVTCGKPLYLSTLAKIMIKLGAVEAATLDGGSSTAMYYRGRFIAHPARRLTNLLAVYDTPEGYQRAFAQISPRKNQPGRQNNTDAGSLTLQL